MIYKTDYPCNLKLWIMYFFTFTFPIINDYAKISYKRLNVISDKENVIFCV